MKKKRSKSDLETVEELILIGVKNAYKKPLRIGLTYGSSTDPDAKRTVKVSDAEKLLSKHGLRSGTDVVFYK